MTPFGPVIVSPDEVDPVAGLELVCEVDGVVRQRGTTADMNYLPGAAAVLYFAVYDLEPGDLVATGTRRELGFVAASASVVEARSGNCAR